MTMAVHPASTTGLDVARAIPPGSLVVAVTDDGADPRYAVVRAAATDIAAAAEGAVLLLYVPPSQSPFGPVRSRRFVPPTDCAGRPSPRPHTGSRRRDLLGAEASVIRDRGVGVAVWLAGRPGPAGLAEAVSRMHAALILLPAERNRPGVIRRTLEYDAARIEAPVVAVDPTGGLARVVPLGEGCADVVAARPRQPTAPLAGPGRQGRLARPRWAPPRDRSGKELVERGGGARGVQARKTEHILDRSQQPVVVVERR
jgi:hypothetical protein